MTVKSIKYIALLTLIVFTALTSCTDDELIVDDNDVPEEVRNGFSLSFTTTLDKMGGATATRGIFSDLRSTAKELEEMESYIDVQKFRVLFFAGENFNEKKEKDPDNDKFLFESTSRWVKKQSTTDGYSSWFVSVPVFGYGNDRDHNWNWDKIKEFLQTKKFKVAILANRPDLEWNMGITNKNNNKDTLTQFGWFDNTGPHWTQKNTLWGNNTKKIFDLHHCQWDPIYEGKNWDNETPAYLNVYDFITGKVGPDEGEEKNYGKPSMGATSTWVSWENNDTDFDSKEWGKRYWLHPSKDHPIPMYGIQEFDPIPEDQWKQGTIFNLNREAGSSGSIDGDKPISLLRSVVKLELLIPKEIEPKYVTLFYPNIYARCEPLDIWTPTNQIWEDENGNPHSDANCELSSIMGYGAVTNTPNKPTGNGTDTQKSIKAYQERMSWFYGLWLEKAPEWNFGSLGRDNVVKEDPDNKGLRYPKIFNTCIQRNTYVVCDNNAVVRDYDDGYNHWVVYCGERNINDPSKLFSIWNSGNGEPTVIYWMISANGHTYCIPLTDYQNKPSTDTAVTETILVDAKDKSNKGPFIDAPPSGSVMNPYELIVQNGRAQLKPWPLLRNHVYRFTIESIPGTRSARTATKNGSPSTDNFMIKSENLYSKSISFD